VTSGPQIADLRVEDVTATSAVVKFNTDRECQGFVYIGETPGDYTRIIEGPMFVNGHTIAVNGLSSGKTYYFKVAAKFPVSGYTSETSEQSFETLSAVGIGNAKLLANDKGVFVTDAMVSRVFGGYFYAEHADRGGGGIRVAWDGVVQSGDVVSVAGRLGTTSDSERQIVATSVAVTGHADTRAIWVNLDLLGGGPLQYSPTYGSGQRGVQVREWLPSSTVPGSLRYMTNVPNLGLLVTATGSLSSPVAGLYYLDHGALGAAAGDCVAADGCYRLRYRHILQLPERHRRLPVAAGGQSRRRDLAQLRAVGRKEASRQHADLPVAPGRDCDV